MIHPSVVCILVSHKAAVRANPSLFVVGEGLVDQLITVIEIARRYSDRLFGFDVSVGMDPRPNMPRL
jgi:hypothetical protein